MRVVLDPSTIVTGRALKFLQEGEVEEVVLPDSVLALFEYEARRGQSVGYAALAELEAIRRHCDEFGISFLIHGEGPGDWAHRGVPEERAKGDAVSAALELGFTLLTSDSVQARVAAIKGASYLLLEAGPETPKIEDFFDSETMSVHIRAGRPPVAKKGTPANFRLVELGERPLSDEEVEDIATDVVERARAAPEAFIEIDEEGATVVQLREYRIVIARPPFSDRIEITAVRPLVKLNLDYYRLPREVVDRLLNRARGILIAGAPGMGKSTFAQALAEFYASKGKIVKTMERPRDLQLSDLITQFTALGGRMDRTGDILLLLRPDFTIFDEMRTTDDFRVFSDMRLAGVGMVGVVHATRPIDAIQRLIGRVELGVIPQVVDTVIFIDGGRVTKIYTLEYTVKVPTGMVHEELARPVIEVRDFQSGELEYEIYMFGEQVSVVPIRRVARRRRQRVEGIEVKKRYIYIDAMGATKVILEDESGPFASFFTRGERVRVRKGSGVGKRILEALKRGTLRILRE